MNSDADVALLHDNDVFRFNQGTDSEGHGDTLIDVKVVDGVKVGKLSFNNDQTSVEREHANAGNITSADDDARRGRRDDKPPNSHFPPVDISVHTECNGHIARLRRYGQSSQEDEDERPTV